MSDSDGARDQNKDPATEEASGPATGRLIYRRSVSAPVMIEDVKLVQEKLRFAAALFGGTSLQDGVSPETTMKECCLDGILVATAYRNAERVPTLLPPGEWLSLALDIPAGTADRNGVAYQAIRFVWRKDLSATEAAAVDAALERLRVGGRADAVAPSSNDAPTDGRSGNEALAMSDAPAESDRELGQAYRQRMAEMGARRHSEAADKRQKWAHLIQEASALVAEGHSKANAARLVLLRHPEADISPGTLRQKLKSPSRTES